MERACPSASGTESLVFIEDVNIDRSSMTNSEVYRAINVDATNPLPVCSCLDVLSSWTPFTVYTLFHRLPEAAGL